MEFRRVLFRSIVRRFPSVDEFQIEVFRRGTMDEVRLLLEIDGSAQSSEAVSRTVRRVTQVVRRDLGIRVDVTAVPAQVLPRYELQAKIGRESCRERVGWKVWVAVGTKK